MPNLQFEPTKLDLTQVPGPPDEQGNPTVAARVIVMQDATGFMVSVGPFDQAGWDSFLAWLSDPEAVARRQRIREMIEVRDGAPPPTMAPSVKQRT